jgi:hypothetical protein
MKRREQFMAALQRPTPDWVPMFDFLYQQPLYEKLLGTRPEAYNGGYVLASDHSLHDGIPVENILEMLRVGHSYGSSFYGK